MTFRLLAVVVASACVLRVADARAQGIPEPLADYRITSWTSGDGVVLGAVRAIAQDRRGYLWLASEAGLVRFDGFRFAIADIVAGTTRLPAIPTRAVYVARNDTVWTGYGEGHGVYEIADGEVRAVHLRQQIAGFVNVIAEDRRGRLWVGHDAGVHRRDGDRWERLTLEPSARRVTDVHEDRQGTIWVVAGGGLYRVGADDTFERIAAPPNVRAVAEDNEGQIWISDDRFGFRRVGVDMPRPLFDARGMNVLHDRSGNLWVTTIGQGLWKIRRTWNGAFRARRATVETGLVNNETSTMLEDRDGNLWVGSIQGLSRLTPSRLTSFVDIGVVRTVAPGSGDTIWAGTTTGLFALGGSPPAQRAVSETVISALHRARDGTLWAATNDGLHRVVGTQLHAATLAGPPLRNITSIESDANGTLWVCDAVEGLFRVTKNATAVPQLAGIRSAMPVFARVDAQGRLWVAYQGGTLRMLDRRGQVTQFGAAEGMTHTLITAIHQDSRGSVWVGGNGGISLWRGNRFETLTFRTEVWGRTVSAIFDTGRHLWVNFAQVGLMRMDLNDVARAAGDPSYELRYDVFNPGFGASYPDTVPGGASLVHRGDSVWFVTGRGISMLRLSDLARQNTAPPPPVIESIKVDERRHSIATAVLPPRTERLQIDYTVVNVSSTGNRVRFRYRLDGFDTNWVEGTLPQQATYSDLPPGEYRFRVQASTNAANWNGAEASWPFVIQPMFYQTAWFQAFSVVLIGLIGVGSWRLSVRRVRSELAGVYAERLRLSREIHDTLLQNLVGLTLDLTAVSRRVAPPEAREQLVSMRRQVEEYIREVRQSIMNLRSPAIDRHGLVGALRATGERLTAGKVRFTLNVAGNPRPCPPSVETHVLRIGHEAVMNAVRHAHAQRVHMDVAFEDTLLRIRVADDGRGMSLGDAPPNQQHYGLATMQERAAEVGGCCRIESVAGGGVQVLAEFPLVPR